MNDALAIIAALDGVDLDDAQADAVGLLALVAGQDVEPGDDDGTWRIAQRVAPDRVISTVDPESRHMHKSVSEYRDGYKAHIAVEPETGLITATALTPANAGDGPTGVALARRRGTRPASPRRFRLRVRRGPRRARRRRTTPRRSKRSRCAGTRSSAPISSTATTSSSTTPPAPRPAPPATPSPSPPTAARRSGSRCRGCPLRSRCTTANDGRTCTSTPHDAELVAARQAWANGDFADDYRQWRPMVERSIAWLVANGNRRVRYRGVERNQHGLATRVAAINLRRLVNLGLDHHNGTWTLA